MALVTTPGAANADSYASVAEADAYNVNRTFSADWSNAENDVKEAALRQAAIFLDAAFDWTGVATDGVQVLAWPRTSMLSKNGYLIDSTVIPQALKNAQSEFAKELVKNDRAADDDAQKQGVSSVQAGSVQVDFESRTGNSNTLQLRDADLLRMGPEFDYLSRVVPDAVRMLIPPSWYTRAQISRPLIFDGTR